VANWGLIQGFVAHVYMDDLHRNLGASHLCREARKAFTDTLMVSDRNNIAADRAEMDKFTAAWAAGDGDFDNFSAMPAFWKQL
jgi:hypothetical protein